jgi:hydrogenase/urease accessory protein HupE
MRSLPAWIALGLAALQAVMFSAPAVAHESRPVYIEIQEVASQYYRLQWKVPSSVPAANVPAVRLPKSCKASTQLAEFAGPDGVVRHISYRCSRSLASQMLVIDYPVVNPSLASLIRYTAASGERHTAVLGPQQSTWSVPAAETPSAVARQYVWLGMEHIWTGVDHLLFLVCLLWIAQTWRRTLITITGFTLAHSMTLVLSALSVVHVSVPPIEAAIALSVVFLAAEVIHGPCRSLVWLYPIVVSSAFGLLHGFGFAAALAEIGLPQVELATGLLCFNVGVEIGQILFVAGVVGVMRSMQRLAANRRWSVTGRASVASRAAVGYAVGTVAVFWLVQRTAAFGL